MARLLEAMDVRSGRPHTIAAVAATYEEETTFIARGLGISVTTRSSARLYNRPGIVYVPISDPRPSQTALVWNLATLTREGELLVRLVQKDWDLGNAQDVELLRGNHLLRGRIRSQHSSREEVAVQVDVPVRRGQAVLAGSPVVAHRRAAERTVCLLRPRRRGQTGVA